MNDSSAMKEPSGDAGNTAGAKNEGRLTSPYERGRVLSVLGYDAAKTDVWPAMILRFNHMPTESEMRDIYSVVGGWLSGGWFDALNKEHPIRSPATSPEPITPLSNADE